MRQVTSNKYKELTAEFISGNTEISKLSKKYKIPRTSIYSHFDRNGYEPSTDLIKARHFINQGLKHLKYFIKTNICDNSNANLKELNELAVKNLMDTLEKEHGTTATALNDLILNAMIKADTMLDKVSDTKSFYDTMQGIKKLSEVIGLPPKLSKYDIMQEIKELNDNEPFKIEISYINSERKLN